MPDVITPRADAPASPRRSGRIRRLVMLVGMLAVAVPLLTGCLRLQVSMGVSEDDRVSGQIVAATVQTSDTDLGPQLTPPDSLGNRVRVEEYRQDGYVGTRVFFSDLTFGDVQSLQAMAPQSGGSYQLEFQRSGDVVTLAGQVDLSSLPAQGSDVQLTVAFPARVATTNGVRDQDNVVTWKLPAGESTMVRAEVRYPDPGTRSFVGWAGIVGGVTIGMAAIIGAMAYLARNPSLQRSTKSTDPS